MIALEPGLSEPLEGDVDISFSSYDTYSEFHNIVFAFTKASRILLRGFVPTFT